MRALRPNDRAVVGSWIAVAALVAACSGLLGLAGMPSPTLLGSMVGGIAWALRGPRRLKLPRAATTGAQAVVGGAVGAYVQTETLVTIGADLPVVMVVNLLTLGFTVLAGAALARWSPADRATATFGMIAGGASGIVAMARDLHSDERLVAVMQYLRVLVIIALTPLVAGLWPQNAGGGSAVAIADAGLGGGLLFVAISAGVGLPLARVVRLPAGSVLGPLIVGGALTAAGVPFAGTVPAGVQAISLAVIGLGVGLEFTTQSLRTAGRLLAPTVVAIAALLVLCALAGVALAAVTGASALDGYLATTPGGLYVVLATATDTGGDATFILAVQVLRLVIVLLTAPLLARWLRERAS